MSWRSHGDGIVPCGEYMKGREILYRVYERWNHISCGCWIPWWDHDKEEITFVLLASYWANIKNRKRSPKHRRRITQTIGDIIPSNKHCRCLPKHVGNIVDVSPRYMRDSLLSIHALIFFLDVPMPWWSMAISRIRRITLHYTVMHCSC